MRRVGIGVAAVVAAAIVAAIGYREFALIRPMKAMILVRLKDPGSAEFRNVRYLGDWTVQGGVLCGEVNAKNAMGGYVGYHHFEVFEGYVDLYTDGREELLRSGTATWCKYDGVSSWWHLRW